ncbi:MAG: hypothetical protein HYS41_04275 [Candidatus Omnitrophica bacterium]|nr:hypothetical protein [Candidatus Omnitrophota bacterium]
MAKRKRPRDLSQRAKLIVEIATEEVEDKDPDEGKDPAAVSLGRRGGLKGGRGRAQKLSKEQRSEIAKLAAEARWKKSS